jgi:hypothetical protein
MPKKAIYGTPSHSPLSVFRNVNSQKLCITEGFFKGHSIFKYSHTNVFALAGVNSTNNVVDSIKELINYKKAENNPKLKEVFLIFDADLSVNLNVLKALQNMIKMIHEHFNSLKVYVLTWDISLGKGIDDIFNAHGIRVENSTYTIDADVFDKGIDSLFAEIKRNPNLVSKESRVKLNSDSLFKKTVLKQAVSE